ncbi:MAG: hypothetical protein AAGG68_01245 [Bacteroidota bacterium]
MNHRKKIILILGIVSYLLLAITAGYYFKERTVFMDVAFRIFHIVKDGDFAIQAGRFGEAITQWIPLVGSIFEFPIKWIAISYSVGMVFYYFALFLVCFFWLKQEQFALLLLLFNVFLVSYTFWWIQIEFAQAIALSLVTFAWITKAKTLRYFFNWKGILLVVLLHTLFYFHPLIPIVLIYFLLFFKISSGFKIEKRLFCIVLIFVAIEYLFKIFVLGNSSYDATAMKGLDNFARLFPNYFDLPANHNFISYCLTDYYLLPLALIVCSIFYIIHKKKYKLTLLLCFFFGYLLLINVSNYKGILQFHIESFYLPLSLFVLCPLVFDLFPKIKSTRLLVAILVVVLVLRIHHIERLHQPYTARVNWYENLIDKVNRSEYKKVVISSDDVPLETLWLTWASSQEIWLLSSLKNSSQPSSIMISHKPNKFAWAQGKSDVFFT